MHRGKMRGSEKASPQAVQNFGLFNFWAALRKSLNIFFKNSGNLVFSDKFFTKIQAINVCRKIITQIVTQFFKQIWQLRFLPHFLPRFEQ